MAKKKNSGTKAKTNYPIWMWVIWIILAVVAGIWSQERLLYQDSAFSVFRMLNSSYSAEHGRWGVLLLTGPAWLCTQLGLSIQTVLYTLSISGILLPALSSFLIYKIDPARFLYLFPLLVVLATGPEWFFLGTAEMLPALCFGGIALAGMYRSSGVKSVWLYVSAALLILAFYTHPGVLPFLLIIPVMGYARTEDFSPFLTLLFLGLVIIVKLFFTQNSSYESGIFSGISAHNFFGFYNLWSWKYFMGSFSNRYLLPTAIFIIGLLLGWNQKSWKPALVTMGTAVFGVLLVVSIFGIGDSVMMMEKNFAPIVMLLFTPILSLERSDLMHSRFVGVCCIAALIAGAGQRYEASLFYTQRLENLDGLLRNCKSRNIEKAFLPKDSLEEKNWRVTWALPYESLIRSEVLLQKSIALRTQDSLVLNDGQYKPGLFLGADFAYPIHCDTMNKTYFHLSKTEVYKPLYDIKPTLIPSTKPSKKQNE